MGSDIAKEFETFREQCIWIRSCYNTFQDLYDSGYETTELLRDAAGWFFHDLNIVLQEYCLLQIGKLTDQANIGGRDNLTVSYIDNLLEANNLMTDDIAVYSCHINRLGKKLKPVRNRMLAHNDRKTLLANEPMPTFETSEGAEKFFLYLQKYTDEVGRVIGVGPLDYSASNGAGDVQELIMKLRNAAQHKSSK